MIKKLFFVLLLGLIIGSTGCSDPIISANPVGITKAYIMPGPNSCNVTSAEVYIETTGSGFIACKWFNMTDSTGWVEFYTENFVVNSTDTNLYNSSVSIFNPYNPDSVMKCFYKVEIYDSIGTELFESIHVFYDSAWVGNFARCKPSALVDYTPKRGDAPLYVQFSIYDIEDSCMDKSYCPYFDYEGTGNFVLGGDYTYEQPGDYTPVTRLVNRWGTTEIEGLSQIHVW